MSCIKGSKLSEAHKKAISEGHLRAIANGYKPNTNHLIKGWGHITEAQRAAAHKKTSDILRGRPQPMDKVTGAHTDNKAAKEWWFINKALGATIKGKNLSQLIRDNTDLFAHKDTHFKGSGCTATQCLRQLGRPRSDTGRIREMWKGWVIGYPEVSNASR